MGRRIQGYPTDGTVPETLGVTKEELDYLRVTISVGATEEDKHRLIATIDELVAALERAMDFTAESETRANIAEDLRRIMGAVRS